MRVIIAEDAALFRESVASALTAAGFDVVAQVGDPDALLAAVDCSVPDVVIIDVRMPPTYTNEGLLAAGEIQRRHPQVGILVLSHFVPVGAALDLLAGGGAGVGYLLKERVSGARGLIDAIRHVAGGGRRIDPTVAERLMHRRAGEEPLARMTEREREILSMIARGDSNKAIADRLVVSVRTVESHVASVFEKLRLPLTADDNRRVHAVLTYLRAIEPTDDRTGVG
jgi:DNA-binding NarL/FixJ family response regulator